MSLATETHSQTRMGGAPPILRAAGITKRFGHVQALNNVCVDLWPGEIVGLVGDNGAGKSTFVKCLSGVYQPDGGVIEIDQRPVQLGSPMAARQEGIETVYQDLSLATELTVASNVFLGREIYRKGILGRLGFTVQHKEGQLEILAPSHRTDIGIPEDIVEEVARVFGYDNVAPRMPVVPLEAYRFNEQRLREHRIRRLLSTAHGFSEVHCYSWFDDRWLSEIGYSPRDFMTLRNPTAPELARMRTTLLPNLLREVHKNKHHGEIIKLYELGRVSREQGVEVQEWSALAGVVFQLGRTGALQDQFVAVKGTLDDLLSLCANSAPVRYAEAAPDPAFPWIQPGRCLTVWLGEKAVGNIGYLAGEPLRPFGKGGQVVWFELDLRQLTGPLFPQVSHQPFSPYPGSWMDFSILFDAARPYAELMKTLENFSHELVRSWSYQYRFSGKGLEPGKVSYTIRYLLGRDDRTVTSEELTAFQESLVAHLKSSRLELR